MGEKRNITRDTCLAAAAALAIPAMVSASTLYWPDQVASDWLGANNWRTAPGGGGGTATWNNANNDSAIFENHTGAGLYFSASNAVIANTVTFGTGYQRLTLTKGDSTFASLSGIPTVFVNNATATGNVATLTLTGTLRTGVAFNNTGATNLYSGTVRLQGDSSGTLTSGTVTLNSGKMVVSNSGALGTSGVTMQLGSALYDPNTAELQLTNSITLPNYAVGVFKDFGIIRNVNGNNSLPGVTLLRGIYTTGNANTLTNNIYVDGGSLTMGTITPFAAGYTLNLGGTSGTGSVTGVIGGNNNLLVNITGGTWSFSGNNDYSGGTTIANGTLLANTAGSNTGTGKRAVAVNSGGTLGGTGRISPDADFGVTVNSGGKLSPGSLATPVGTLSINLTGTGALDVSGAVGGANAGALVFDLGSTSDRVALTSGSLNIGTGQLEFADFAFTANTGFGVGNYTLIDTGAAILGTLGSSLSGTIVYGGQNYPAAISLGSSSQDIILSVLPIPEPASASVLVLGGLGLLARRKRNTR